MNRFRLDSWWRAPEPGAVVPPGWRLDRASLAVVVGVAIALGAVLQVTDATGDWSFFVNISTALGWHDLLHVYSAYTNIQTGPVSLGVVRSVHSLLGDGGLTWAVWALGCASTWFVLAGPRARRPLAVLVPGAAMVVVYWQYLKTWGHLDDTLTLTLAAAAYWAVRNERRGAAAVMVGVALACKPWVVFLLPLTLTRERSWRAVRWPAVSGLVGAAFWLPFMVADDRTLEGLQPTVRLAEDSLLRLLGFEMADLTSTLRTVQLLLGLAVVTALVVRGRTAGALAAGTAVRLLLDAGTWDYYAAGLLLGAFLWDVHGGRRRWPWMTTMCALAMIPNWILLAPDTRALMRSTACCTVLAVTAWPSSLELFRRPSAADREGQASGTVR